MTDLRTAAQQALEACTDAVSGWQSLAPLAVRRAAEAALDDLRAALAEPENWELRRLREELERCKEVCAATSEAWREEAALAEPVPGQGCDHCNHPLYAATRCRVCGRVISAEPPCATRECMPSECPNCASLEAQNTELDRKLAELEAALRAQS